MKGNNLNDSVVCNQVRFLCNCKVQREMLSLTSKTDNHRLTGYYGLFLVVTE